MNRSLSTHHRVATCLPALNLQTVKIGGRLQPDRAARAARRGMSLLEVMVATVLLLTAVMALSRVAYLARRHATGAADRTQAQLLCQNIMQEILAGARPLAPVSPESFEGNAWVFMVDVEAVPSASLSKITVQVDRLEDETGRLPTEEEMGGFRLVQWMRSAKSPAETSEEGWGADADAGEETPGQAFE
ncbi:MAG: type IV pilus modification PilV family protein [Pirellulaceae bacterium]